MISLQWPSTQEVLKKTRCCFKKKHSKLIWLPLIIFHTAEAQALLVLNLVAQFSSTAGGLWSCQQHALWCRWRTALWGMICWVYSVYCNQFSSIQSLSHVWLFATPWIAARQASLSITNSRSSPKPTSIELVMPSSHLILCRPLLLLPPIPPSIRVFSNESALRMRWPKYWSFSFSIIPSKEHPGLISFRMDWNIQLYIGTATVCKHLPQETEKCINIMDMCEMLAIHFRLPSDLRGSPHFESLGRRQFWLQLIPNSDGSDGTRRWYYFWVVSHRIHQCAALVQDWGTWEFAARIEIIHSIDNLNGEVSHENRPCLGQQSQEWHIIFPAA